MMTLQELTGEWADRDKSLLDVVSGLGSGRTPAAGIDDIYFCFRLLLGRDPNPEEVSGHMSAAGRPLVDVVASFLNSQEFAHRDLLAQKQDEWVLFDCGGYSLYADPADFAVGQHVAAGSYESHVTDLFNRMIRPGDVVLDIGANIGFFSMLAAHIVGPTGRVIAIEPNPANCRLIEASRLANDFDHLTFHALAASQINGVLSLHSVYSNGSVGPVSPNIGTLMRAQIVEGAKLDCVLALDRVDFIKIDVEGFELDALLGFRDHLLRFKPKIVSEFTPGSMGSADSYIRFLLDLGYQIGVVGDGGEVQAVEQTTDAIVAVQKLSGGDHIDIFAIQAQD